MTTNDSIFQKIFRPASAEFSRLEAKETLDLEDEGYRIVKRSGHYGITDCQGEELVPCVMDEIFLKANPDGCMILRKDKKWGLFDGCACAMPVFDELRIISEDFTKARIGTGWGWVDMYGNLTQDKSEAQFGEWYDFLK